MKVLITSDNHLGYKETDPIRFEDSFNTFDEILALAKSEHVDFVLQAGDLFHENKPSRNTYNKTLQILSKYCIGENDTTIKSDSSLNFNNPKANVSLPIFSIHGNHDDPSGLNSISALDIIHSGGFINYFGRVSDVDNIELKPILIEKGNTKIALYGLGYIKDRRLYKTFLKGNVKYTRPVGDDWYNVLLVHQNRVYRQNEYLPEDFIDPFFDLVVYGHEHESIKIRHRHFDVIQCGSSVRTSLCEGESYDKYAYILDLQGTPAISRIKLRTVRPLILENLKISTGDADLKIKNKIESVLANEGQIRNSLLPLIRLRIEIGSDTVFNKNNISLMLENKVANPADALRIIRKAEKKTEDAKAYVQRAEIEDIYRDVLNRTTFKALIPGKVVDSLKDFVEKDAKEAFTNLIKDSVAKIMENIKVESIVGDNIEEVVRNTRDLIFKQDFQNGHSISNSKDSDSQQDEITENEYFDSKRARDDSKISALTDMHDEIFKSVSLPKESSSICINTSVLISKDTEEYTFIEERAEKKDNEEFLKNIKSSEKENFKKPKIEDSSDDLLVFTKYIKK